MNRWLMWLTDEFSEMKMNWTSENFLSELALFLSSQWWEIKLYLPTLSFAYCHSEAQEAN